MKVDLKITKPQHKAVLSTILAQKKVANYSENNKVAKLFELLETGSEEKEGRIEFSNKEVLIADINLASYLKTSFEDFFKTGDVKGINAKILAEVGELLEVKAD